MQNSPTDSNKRTRKQSESTPLTEDQDFEVQLVTKIIALLQRIYDYAGTNPIFHVNLVMSYSII